MEIQGVSRGFSGLKWGASVAFTIAVTSQCLAVMPQMNYLGTVTEKIGESGFITVETDYCIGCGCGGDWEVCAATLVGTVPNPDAWDAINVGDYIEGTVFSCGCEDADAMSWASLARLMAKDEPVLVDVFGDPDYLELPLRGNHSFSYSNEPDCAICGCASCEAKASTVSIGAETFRLLPGEEAAYEDEEYRIEFTFHSGRAPAKPICTDEDPCPGPQLYSDFTIHVYKVSEAQFSRGDANGDNTFNIADAVCVLSYLFGPVGDPCKEKVAACFDAADANDDGSVDISDGVYILQNLFASGLAIPPPYPGCGLDPTLDNTGVGLDCQVYEYCP